MAIFRNNPSSANKVLQAIKQQIDSPEVRQHHSKRISTVESLSGNIRYNKLSNLFTLHGSKKFVTQWRLYCMVHNIDKLTGCDFKYR